MMPTSSMSPLASGASSGNTNSDPFAFQGLSPTPAPTQSPGYNNNNSGNGGGVGSLGSPFDSPQGMGAFAKLASPPPQPAPAAAPAGKPKDPFSDLF